MASRTAIEESIYAAWHDPMTYDHLRHGPPYLPESKAAPAPAGKLVVQASVRPLVDKMAAAIDVELSVILSHIVSDFGSVPQAELAALLSFLRALALAHQTHHWQTRGQNFYGDHLIFDRLYNETIKFVDPLAERLVGMGNHMLVHPVESAKHISAITQNFYAGAATNPTPNDYVQISLRAIFRFLVLHRIVYSMLEGQGLLSHGIGNMLQGIADGLESHVYLLKQRATSSDVPPEIPVVPVSTKDARWKSG